MSQNNHASDMPDWPAASGTGIASGAEAAPRQDVPAEPTEPAQRMSNTLEDVRWVLGEFEDSLRARAVRHPAHVNGTAIGEDTPLESDPGLDAAAEEVARCRSELDRLQTVISGEDTGELTFSVIRKELQEAGRRTERTVEAVADALDRIDAERCLLAAHYAEQMEAAQALIERWRSEQEGYETGKSADLGHFLGESSRAAEAMREAHANLGLQMESLRAAANGFAPAFEQAEKRLVQRFDEQQAELARQRGWIEQKLEEMRSELDRSRRTDMAQTRTFVLILQFAAALLPVAAVALALFLPAILRWLNLGS